MNFTEQDEKFLKDAIAHYDLFINALEPKDSEEMTTARLILRQQRFHAERFLERVKAARNGDNS